LGDPPAQRPLMLEQARAAVAANLLGPTMTADTALIPEPLHALATHPKTLANLTGAFPLFARLDYAPPQIFT